MRPETGPLTPWETIVYLRNRFLRRVNECKNTAMIHPDPTVRAEMKIRALCYENAYNDVLDAETTMIQEEMKRGLAKG